MVHKYGDVTEKQHIFLYTVRSHLLTDEGVTSYLAKEATIQRELLQVPSTFCFEGHIRIVFSSFTRGGSPRASWRNRSFRNRQCSGGANTDVGRAKLPRSAAVKNPT